MAIRGNLRTMQLSELMQWLSMGQKTGTLVVRGRQAEKQITFEGGRIISSSSTMEREYLGHFLVAFGYITEEELTRAMQVQEESKILLGKILVMIGAIQEDELAELIRLKASETIYDMFLWNEGAFEFKDGEIPKLPMIPASVDVTGIVMEGLRRYDEWQRMKVLIPTTRLITRIVGSFEAGQLTEQDRQILGGIDGTRSIEEVSLATHVPEFFVARFVYQLLTDGAAEIAGELEIAVEAEELAPEDPYETVFEDAQAGAFPDALTVEEDFPPPPRSGGYSKPTQQDFSRYLRRSGDSSAGMESGRASRTPSSQGSRDGVYRLAPLPPSAPPAAAQEPRRRSSGSMPALGPSSPKLPAPAAPPPTPPPAPRPRASVDGDASYPLSAVPVLTKPMDELMSWSFTPNEAFVVSRINGLWDVRSIAKISPFSETEVMRVFRKLEDGGVISWR